MSNGGPGANVRLMCDMMGSQGAAFKVPDRHI
jgi:hypothetical protein